MLTTIQDLGRWGHQAAGVPVAGPMDVYSHRLANQLVGNSENAAALEITLIGPELVAHGDLLCAVAGAEFTILVGGHPVHHTGAFRVPAGAAVRFGERRAGARATLAVRGGIAVPPVFGSRATSVLSHMGPFGGDRWQRATCSRSARNAVSMIPRRARIRCPCPAAAPGCG